MTLTNWDLLRQRSEAAYTQAREAAAIVRAVTRTSDPATVAWALGVTHSQHPGLLLPMLTIGQAYNWCQVDMGCVSWDPEREGAACRYVYDKATTTFWATETDRGVPLLRIPNTAVNALLLAAGIPADLLADLRKADQQTGAGRNDAERAETDRRGLEIGVAVWDLARPVPSGGLQLDLLDMVGGGR